MDTLINSRSEEIDLDLLKISFATQTRAKIYASTVKEYAGIMERGIEMPPPILFKDANGASWIADGFHRIFAARSLRLPFMKCTVADGEFLDAVRYSLGCNADHGLQRTNKDKWAAVTCALTHFPSLSDQMIADISRVGRNMVAKVRRQQADVIQSTGNVLISDTSASDSSSTGYEDDEKSTCTRVQVEDDNEPASEGMLDEVRIGKDGKSRKIPKKVFKDGIERPIPPEAISTWKQKKEFADIATAINNLISNLEEYAVSLSKAWRTVNIEFVTSSLENARNLIEKSKPYTVCPFCQGRLAAHCTFCEGAGMISKHVWNSGAIKEETKVSILKAIKEGTIR